MWSHTTGMYVHYPLPTTKMTVLRNAVFLQQTSSASQPFPETLPPDSLTFWASHPHKGCSDCYLPPSPSVSLELVVHHQSLAILVHTGHQPASVRHWTQPVTGGGSETWTPVLRRYWVLHPLVGLWLPNLLVNQPYYGRQSSSMTIQVSIQAEIWERREEIGRVALELGLCISRLANPDYFTLPLSPSLLSRDCLIILSPPPPRVESLVPQSTFTPVPTCQRLKCPKLYPLICVCNNLEILCTSQSFLSHISPGF